MMGTMGRAVSGPRPQPTWMEPGSAFHIKPAAGWSWINDREYAMFSSLINDADSASFSRASEAYGLNSLGNFELFASGVPAITDLGLLVEDAETNYAASSITPSDSLVATRAAVTANQIGPINNSAVLVTADGASGSHAKNTGSGTYFESGQTYFCYAVVENLSSGYAQLVMPSGAFGTQVYANFDLSGNGATGTKGTNTTTSGFLKLATGRFLIWLTATATGTATTVGSVAFVPASNSTRLVSSTSTASYLMSIFQATKATRWGSPIAVALDAAPVVPVTRAAVAFTLKPLAATYDVTVKFGDGTADQVLSGQVVGGGGWACPATLNGRFVTDIIGVTV